MLSLLGSLLGFGTSFLPGVLDFFKQKQADKHELAMMAEQRETTLAVGAQKLQMVQVAADSAEIVASHKEQASSVRKAGKFIAGLSASVRPVVTYLFVLEFLLINSSIAYLTLTQAGFTIEALQSILDDRFFTLLATMISFWFGNRTFGKRKS